MERIIRAFTSFLAMVSPTLFANLLLANKNAAFKKTLSDFSYSLALQAANWGLPIVIMYTLRYNEALKPDAKSKPNNIWRLDNIATPSLSEKLGIVTPSVNVIYGFGFLDLNKEPIILNVPDSNNRYYVVQLVDMYTNSFAYAGGVATGYKGGQFAIVGPGWQGTLPENVTPIYAPTPWIVILPRVHVMNETDVPAAKKVLDEITVKGLAQFQGQPASAPTIYHSITPDLKNTKLPVSAVNFKDPMQFWEILSTAINENPPPKNQIDALLPMFKLLGINFGKQWGSSEVSPIVLNSMKRAAQEIGTLGKNLPVGRVVNSWFVPPSAVGNTQNDYYLRAIVARVGLLANTPKEAIYFLSWVDSKGQILMSNKKYTLTFKQLPSYEAPGFWSLSLYSLTNNYNVENPINRYSLGSDDQMTMNPDGSLTLYIQGESPGANKESNWLPTGNVIQLFYLVLRSYVPGQDMIDALSNPKLFTVPAPVEVIE